MDLNWTTIFIAALGLLGSGAIGGFIGARANAAKAISDAAVALVKPLRESVCSLEKRVDTLEKDNERLSRQVREFRELIRALWDGVLIYSKQLHAHGIPLAWNMTEYRELVEKALGEPES